MAGYFSKMIYVIKGLLQPLACAHELLLVPGQFVDDAVEKNPNGFVFDDQRRLSEANFGLMGLRWKARLLPRLRVSFPVTDNSVLYFNYSHACVPRPRFVYAAFEPCV